MKPDYVLVEAPPPLSGLVANLTVDIGWIQYGYDDVHRNLKEQIWGLEVEVDDAEAKMRGEAFQNLLIGKMNQKINSANTVVRVNFKIEHARTWIATISSIVMADGYVANILPEIFTPFPDLRAAPLG